MQRDYKLFSDPVHGFISVPRALLFELIQTPEVQRLRRIRQLGVGYLVFPGAEHTRFGHALGAMALMQETLTLLANKGTPISYEERQAALAAALLHDIGHGPFSHTLEHDFIRDFHHEQMSRLLLVHLNERFGDALALALQMFDNTYERPFFHQLIASQLDMDRLDYLRRDSFYTGVVEGRVGVERILKTLRVHPVAGGPDAEVVIEGKGIYAVENFLIARRLMYWQVYLHKTVLAGDHLLRGILRRVRHLLASGQQHLCQHCAPAFLFFLERRYTGADLERPQLREAYCALDDTDVLYSIKQWTQSDDPTLADLAERFVNRRFFRVTFLSEAPSADQWEAWQDVVSTWLGQTLSLSPDAAERATPHYLTLGQTGHAAYRSQHNPLRVLDRTGTIHELSAYSNSATFRSLTDAVEQRYVCYPKGAHLPGLRDLAGR